MPKTKRWPLEVGCHTHCSRNNTNEQALALKCNSCMFCPCASDQVREGPCMYLCRSRPNAWSLHAWPHFCQPFDLQSVRAPHGAEWSVWGFDTGHNSIPPPPRVIANTHAPPVPVRDSCTRVGGPLYTPKGDTGTRQRWPFGVK
jgi:hypothetical protein